MIFKILVGSDGFDFHTVCRPFDTQKYYDSHTSNCTWWAAARYEDTHNGKDFKNAGHAYSSVNINTISADSIAVYGDANDGHFRFVEYVDGNTVYFSEANVNSTTDFRIQKTTLSDFEKTLWRQVTFKGYIK